MFRKSIVLAFTGLLLAGSAAPAFAENAWERSHPWRDQVNDRVGNQFRRINYERREGDLSRGQARALRTQERGVLAEERADARLHNGHITRYEQGQLNRDLNSINREIPR